MARLRTHAHRTGTRGSRRGPVLTALAVLPASFVLSLAPTAAHAAGGGVLPLDQVTPDLGSLVPAVTESPTVAVLRTPASVTRASTAGPLSARARATTVSAAARAEVPAPALAAYQRAATVMDASDPGCHLGWELVAAIGKVESDHGRYGGSRLDPDGVAHPAIYGIALDGRHGTRAVPDTDAGLHDGNPRWDRAVGPMQFVPATWAVVGVDADGDTRRDPQDVDDAALASGVYLCSGDEDLATPAGRAAAVLRYNHSARYVALVLATARGYARGVVNLRATQMSPVSWVDRVELGAPVSVAATGGHDAVGPTAPAAGGPRPSRGHDAVRAVTQAKPDHGTRAGTTSAAAPSSQPAPAPTTAPTKAPAPPLPKPKPAPLPTPAPAPDPAPAPPPATPPAPTPADAEATCAARGLVDDPAVDGDAFDTCLAEVLAAP